MIVFIDDQAPVCFFLFEAVYGGNIPTNDLRIFRTYSAFIKDFEAKPQEYKAIKALVLDMRVSEPNGQLCFKDDNLINLESSSEGLGFLGAIDTMPSLFPLKDVPKVILTQLSVADVMRQNIISHGIEERYIFNKHSDKDRKELRDFLKQALR